MKLPVRYLFVPVQVCVLLVGMFSESAYAQFASPPEPVGSRVPVMVTAREGCRIQAPPHSGFAGIDPQGRYLPARWDFAWSGACVAGTAYGPGILSMEFSSGTSRSVETLQQTVDAGVAFGYVLRTHEPSLALPPEVRLIRGGRTVAFTEGWGLDTRPFAAGVTHPMMPPVVPFRPVSLYQSILIGSSSGFRSLAVVSQPGADPSGTAPITYMVQETRDGGVSGMSLCPAPGLAACQPLIERMGAPLRDEVLAFIREAMPELEAQYAKMRQALGEPAAAAQPAAAAAAPARDLEAMPVGALFSAADEALAKGDKAGARAALRTLLRRFPNHALAAPAAQQLSALSGQ